MNVLELKGSLFDMIWGVDDSQMLLKIRELVMETIDHARTDEPDWWDGLTPAQQTRLDGAISDAKAGKNLVGHEEILQKMEERFKTLGNGH